MLECEMNGMDGVGFGVDTAGRLRDRARKVLFASPFLLLELDTDTFC